MHTDMVLRFMGNEGILVLGEYIEQELGCLFPREQTVEIVGVRPLK